MSKIIYQISSCRTKVLKLCIWVTPVRPHLEQFWAPHYERHGQTGDNLTKGHKVIEGTRTSLLWGKAGEQGRHGHLINVYKYLEGKCKEDGAGVFSVVPAERTRGIGHKLTQRRCHLNIRKHRPPLGGPAGTRWPQEVPSHLYIRFHESNCELVHIFCTVLCDLNKCWIH